MVFSVLYWGAWRVVLPGIFKYELVPEKAVLQDGTVVTVVCFFETMSQCIIMELDVLLTVCASQDTISWASSLGDYFIAKLMTTTRPGRHRSLYYVRNVLCLNNIARLMLPHGTHFTT